MATIDGLNDIDQLRSLSMTLMNLPDDILYSILSFCAVHDFLHLESTCKRFRDIVRTHETWHEKLLQLDHVRAPDVPPHIHVGNLSYHQIRQIVSRSIRLYDSVAFTGQGADLAESLGDGVHRALAQMGFHSSLEPIVSQYSDAHYHCKRTVSLHPPYSDNQGDSEASLLAHELAHPRAVRLTVRRAKLSAGGRYLFVVWTSWNIFRRTDQALEIFDLGTDGRDCKASQSGILDSGKPVWRYDLVHAQSLDNEGGFGESTTVMEHEIHIVSESEMMVTFRVYNPQLNLGHGEVIRLLRSDDQWLPDTTLSQGRYSYHCSSPRYAVFMKNESITVIRWNESRAQFEQVHYPCDAFTGPMYAHIWTDRCFYLKLDNDKCSIRSFSLTEAFLFATDHASKKLPSYDQQNNFVDIRVPDLLEEALSVSSLLIDIPGHVADLRFSVYTPPSTEPALRQTFPSSASILILVLSRPLPRSAPAHFIALNASFTSRLPTSQQWRIVARSKPQIHPEFGVDGMYLYVELLSRMSKRGWLLVNLMKRVPERAGFIRVRALVALVPTPTRPPMPSKRAVVSAIDESTGPSSTAVGSMSLFFPRLPSQLRDHYLPNIPLTATEGVDNSIEEFSGAMIHITIKNIADGEGANVVEVWYPGESV